ncbi:hypothetical protein MVEN_01387000 [Mycena venus]|uniref:Uncharacterized protein n=1 Tax=Mycena venus TaxID=2733690 RepID=A0A8H6XYM6_9AGAR|nr:hypothetical protein MVEN_01387000 [Mycena venus]
MSSSPCVKHQSRVARQIPLSEPHSKAQEIAQAETNPTQSSPFFSVDTIDSDWRFTHCASDSDSSSESEEQVFEFPRPPRSALEATAFFSRYSHSPQSSVDSIANSSHSGCSSLTSSGPPTTPTSPTHSMKTQMQMRSVRPLNIKKRATAARELPLACASSGPTVSLPCSSSSTSLSPRSSSLDSAPSPPFHTIAVQREEQDAPDQEYYAAHARAFVALARPPRVPVLLPEAYEASAASSVSAGGGAETCVTATAAPLTQKGSHSTSAPSACTLCESGVIPALPAMSTDTRGNSNPVAVRPTRAPPPSPSAVSSSSSAKLVPSPSSSHLQNSHLHPTTRAASNSHPCARATFDANANARLFAFKFPEDSAHDHCRSHSPSYSTSSERGGAAPPTSTNAVFFPSYSSPRVVIASSNLASPSPTPTPEFHTESRFSLDANANASAVSSLDFPSQSPFPFSASASSATAKPRAAVPNFSRPTSLALALLMTAPSASVLPRGPASPVLCTADSGSSYSGHLADEDEDANEGRDEAEPLADFAADYAAYAPLLRTPMPSPRAACESSRGDTSMNSIPVNAVRAGDGALRGEEADIYGDGEWDASILYADEDEEEHELSPRIAPAPSPFLFAECSAGDGDEEEDEDDAQAHSGAAWHAPASGSMSCPSSSSCAPLPVSLAPYRQTQHTPSYPPRRYSRHDAAPELRSRWSSSTLSSQQSAHAENVLFCATLPRDRQSL